MADGLRKPEPLSFESRDSITVLKRKFAEICAPRGNVVKERHKFNTRTQMQGEQSQSFVADLRIDHFTVVDKLPDLRMEAWLPVTCFDTNL